MVQSGLSRRRDSAKRHLQGPVEGRRFRGVDIEAVQLTLDRNVQQAQAALGQTVQHVQRQLAAVCGAIVQGFQEEQKGVKSLPGLRRRKALQLASSSNGLVLMAYSEADGHPEKSARRKASGKKGVQLVDSVVTIEEKPAQRVTLRTLIDGAIAGAVAGVSVETALYPIDTIKTRLQAAAAGGQINFKGLYSGLQGNLAGVIPASALFVGVYEPLKTKLLHSFPDEWSSAAHLTAAAAAGAAASLVRVPTEVIKQRMQTGQFSSASTAFSQILNKEGFRGLYAGYGSFLLRDLPFDAIQFVAYEQLKLAVLKAGNKRELSDLETAAIGAFSGALTGAITTPLDCIKTRLMVQGTNVKYAGIADCVSKMCKEEGASALFKGIGPRVLWIGIGGSIFFGVLERVKSALARQAEVAVPPPHPTPPSKGPIVALEEKPRAV